MLRKIVPAIMIAATLVSSSYAQFQQPGPGQYTTMSFDKADFDQSIANSVAPNVMGYQYALVKGGQLVTEGAGGKAANAADGNRDMTVHTPHPIGSLSKFFSGTTMLHLMVNAAGPGGQWDAGLTLNQKLDRPFTSIVPSVWANGNKWGIENITIRELLQHKSGFDAGKPTGGRTVLDYLKDNNGYWVWQHGTREYANINFVLMGYLIHMYEWPAAAANYDAYHALHGMNQEEADTHVRNASGDAMHIIMKSRIWNNMTPEIEPNCNATNTLQNSAAYFYLSDTDNTAGGISSAINTQGHCGGEGWYYISARDLANYMAHFASTDVVVNSEARNLMYNDAMDPDDRLVWGSASTDAWITDKFGMPNIIWSNGVGDNSQGGYRAVIVRLPQNYYFVMMTNSPDMSAGQLRQAGVQAFRDAMDHNF